MSLVRFQFAPTRAARRPRRRRGRTKLIVALVLLVATSMLGAAALLSMSEREEPFDVAGAVDLALEALDEPNISRARRLAADLRRNHALDFEQLGGPAFVLGATMALDAESQQSRLERRRQFLIASRYLEEARQRGFPRGRQKQGLTLLAETTFKAEQYEDAIPRLQVAMQRAPERSTQFARMLSLCHRRRNPPDWEAALLYADQYLADTLLTPDQLAEAKLNRAEILFHLKRPQECRAQAAEVVDREHAGAAMVLRARILIDEAREENARDEPDVAKVAQLYADAAKELEHPFVTVRKSSDSSRLAQLLLGECYVQLGRLDEALQQFGQVRRQYYGLPEAQAAAFEEADLLRRMKRDDKAIAAYVAMLSRVDEAALEANPILQASQLRTRLSAAYNDLFRRKQFKHALALVDAMSGLVTAADMLRLKATAYRAWAEKLQADAERQTLAEAEETHKLAYEKLRLAGDAYAQLAELRSTTDSYTNDLYRSAQSYLEGNDFRLASQTIELFFHARPRNLVPEALVMHGRALLSLNRLDEAVEPLLRCIDRHREAPESYEARLVLSRVYNEQQQIGMAKKVLRDNLESNLRPESQVWRASLYELGRVLFLEATRELAKARAAGLTSPGDSRREAAVFNPEALAALRNSYQTFGKANYWMEQAIARWPEDDRSILIRYMNAKAHEHRAKLPRFRLVDEQIEGTRDKLNLEMTDELSTAHKQYEELILYLDKRQDNTELTKIEQKILRNCYFARADTLFELERFNEAIQAYSSASNRYQQQPCSLEALVQIAACYRRLNNDAKARGTLEQAKVVLDRIGPQADYAATTSRVSYDAWSDFLTWLSQI